MRAYSMKKGAITGCGHCPELPGSQWRDGARGAISGYPVIVAYGMVYATSGAASMTHPGNALLAFELSEDADLLAGVLLEPRARRPWQTPTRAPFL